MSAPKIKVCGMAHADNLHELVAEAAPDFVGFIFYPKSPRYVGQHVPPVQSSGHAERVGVFANEANEYITAQVRAHSLHYVQLHGDETPQQCAQLAELLNGEAGIIKAFRIDENFNFADTAPYSTHCRYFLFDTKVPQYGGSGQSFDWALLKSYHLPVPFFLSGGIDLAHAPAIARLGHPALFAVDINSRFELAPGLKDVPRVAAFVRALRHEAAAKHTP